MTPARTARSVAALIALAGISWAVSPVVAQTALGDGTALDASPSSQGRVNPARPSFSRELQFRNAIVTGNAPGGLSFRGDLGYRAPGEFTGQLGSDELFSFRRDSLGSGLAGMGIRGTDALQYQFSLSTGAQPPRNLMGDLSFTRDAQYQTSAAFSGLPSTTGATGLQRDPSDPDPRGLNLYQPSPQETDLADALMGAMRSASTYSTTRNLSPVILATYEEGFDRDPFGLTASVLTGVTSVPMRRPDDPTRRPGMPAGQPGMQPGVQPGFQPGAGEQRGQVRGQARDPTRVRTAYDEIVERVQQRAAVQAERSVRPGADEGAEQAQTIRDRIEAVRRGMLGSDQQPQQPTDPAQQRDQQPGQQPSQQPGQRPGMTEPTRPGAIPGLEMPDIVPPGALPDLGQPDPDRAGEPATDRTRIEQDPRRFAMDPDTLELIRALEAPLTSFVAPDSDSRDLYSEHMRTGERLIAAERYFDAEERFARALSIRPGDPTAQVGRAHAQLGAGLLLSASVNLRSLFFLNPEVLGARYAGRLLPSPDRIDQLIEILKERAGVVRVPGRPAEDDATRVAAGFTLAYLGYQNGRADITRQGLDVMREIGSDEDVRAASIFEQVWLPEDDRPDDAPNAGAEDR